MRWRQLSAFDHQPVVASKQSRQALAMWRLHSGKENQVCELMMSDCRIEEVIFRDGAQSRRGL
jgi:hypothetical protein